jgi:ADP-heptose:LPS heptosyltransferase
LNPGTLTLKKPPRALLVQFKRLGDTLLAEPLVRALRAAGWSTVWLDHETNLPAAKFLRTDRLVTWPKGLTALKTLRNLRAEKFDAVIDLGGTDRCAFVARLCGAKSKIAFARFAQRPLHRWGGFDFVPSKVWNQHTIDHFLNLLKPLGLSPVDPTYPVVVLPPTISPVLRTRLPHLPPPRSYAILHLGAARSEKFWPTGRWIEVAEFLSREYSLAIVLTGGLGAEETSARLELTESFPAAFNLGGLTSLEETALLYSEARLVITVDSMSAHLAPAVGAPTLVLFGPMNPLQWAPRQPACRALRGGHPGGPFLPTDPPGSMEALSTGTVIQTIREMLDS